MITSINTTSETSLGINNGNLNIVDNSTVAELQDSSGDLVVLRAAGVPSSSTTLNDVPNFLDLKGVGALIQFSFSGDSAPSAGSNTGTFGFCHTTGGSYTAGNVVYDDGTSLTIQANVKSINTTDAISGTISLNTHGHYVKISSTWTLTGDGSSSSTYAPIQVAFSSSVLTATSSTAIPDGAMITRRILIIDTASDGTDPSIIVATNGTSPVTLLSAPTVTNFPLSSAAQYELPDLLSLDTGEGGNVVVTVTDSDGTTLDGSFVVFYTVPSN